MSKGIWNDRYLYLFVIPGVIWFLIFCYQPMYGVLIAFKDYDIVAGVYNSEWVGLKYFSDFFHDFNFNSIMINTIAISLLKLLIGFPAPIILALLLNEVKKKMFKRITQTVTYLPFFVSWVVVSGIWYELLTVDQGGIVNTFLMNIGLLKEPVFWFGNPDYFWGLVVASDIWKGIGWGSIIYLAALSGVDVDLYEAAVMDGASRWKQTWHITLPGIRSTIIILFILNVGSILNAGFDQIYVMQNPAVMDRAQIIDTYVMTTGIFQANYSIAAAVGLFKSIVGLIMLLLVNALVKILGEEGVL
ncbi:protein lplB [Paenibacillus sp. MY03]|jgi:putative aldouronate transport system permease protein|uniref:ABC transporter permease n=1 Tax=Paenibacillus sp. MY03 TaxID=302980 RepID=UPI000B3CC7D1|nr:ABC transporter permease subunit [Paenibacillus sp. MY03]OUS77104.1 protein lplB [Paenibacillus sp. MY03]